jgi:hypothetical protein
MKAMAWLMEPEATVGLCDAGSDVTEGLAEVGDVGTHGGEVGQGVHRAPPRVEDLHGVAHHNDLRPVAALVLDDGHLYRVGVLGLVEEDEVGFEGSF